MQYWIGQLLFYVRTLLIPRRYVRGHLLVFAGILLLLCLFKPQLTLPTRVYDWLIVIDISQSMNVRDYQIKNTDISRLDFVKQSVNDALLALPCGSKVAIGVFAERNTLNVVKPVEVCGHYAAIAQTIKQLNWRMAWAADSFIAHGTYSAIGLAGQLGSNFHVALMTDGEQAPPADPRYMPKFEGEVGKTKGYLLGVGKTEKSQIPKLDVHDEIVGYWQPEDVQRYANFGMARTLSVLAMEQRLQHRNAGHGPDDEAVNDAHLSGLDEANLKKIAQETGLHYQPLGKQATLSEVLQSMVSQHRPEKTDLRPWLAMPAGILLLVYFFTAFYWQPKLHFFKHLRSAGARL